MHDSVTFRFRETSKYSHRYGQTCSTYVIATAHACGLVEGTLARDHWRIGSALEEYPRRSIYRIQGNSNKNVLQNRATFTFSCDLRLANWPAVGFRKRPFLRIFTQGKGSRNEENRASSSNFRSKLPNFSLYDEKTKKIDHLLSQSIFP